MKRVIIFLLFLTSLSVWAEEGSVWAKLLQRRPQKIVIKERGKPDVILKIKTLPPKGMSEEEYQKKLEERELKAVVHGVDKFNKEDLVAKRLGGPKQRCTEHCDEHDSLLAHTPYLGSQGVGPFSVAMLRIPLNTASKAEDSVSLISNVGNTMVHDMTLHSKDGKSISYQFDAVNEVDGIDVKKAIDDKNELEIRLKFFSATGSGEVNPAKWLVGDGFIESFHGQMGLNDPFKRKENGYDKVVIHAVDEDGDEINLQGDKVYIMPLEVGTTHYEELYKSDQLHLSANANINAAIPIADNELNNHFSVGSGVNLNATTKLTDRLSLTGAANVGIVKHDILNQSKQGRYDFTNRDTYKSGKVLVGINHQGEKMNTSFFGAYGRSSSAYTDFDIDGGVENQPLMVKRYAYYAPTKPQEYFEVGTAVNYKRDNGDAIIIELTVREDFQSERYTEMDSPLTGNNNEDFGAFVGIQYKF